MSDDISQFENIVEVERNPKYENIFDVQLNHVEDLKKYNSFECHIVLYPYNRKITSDHFHFNPFEEYVKDIRSNHRSAYERIESSTHQIFGILLGFIIFFLFYFLNPTDLFSVESIISIFGAYAIGKEFWSDIEDLLVRITKRWKIRVIEPYFSYRMEPKTTLTNYSLLAKKRRYGKYQLLPQEMEFFAQSNSETIRMKYFRKELQTVHENSVHILSLHVNSSLLQDFEESGYLLGIKISCNKQFLGVQRSYELFQSIDKNSLGCLDESGKWKNNGVFWRKTLSLGRLKYFRKSGIIENGHVVHIVQ